MTDADLLLEYRNAFEKRMKQDVGSSNCHDAALRAVYERGRRDGALLLREELSVLVAHSGATDRREWHTVGAWLYPGEGILEGKLVTDHIAGGGKVGRDD